MKILVDMNLSPPWVIVLKDAGHEVIHWSTIGASGAPDKKILAWAQSNRHVVFTIQER
jgi:predicted nuclease of predicted toxin-antitoxin system